MSNTMWDRNDWNREGQAVSFLYKGSVPCSGKVTSSRVLYGGDVQHTVILDVPRMALILSPCSLIARTTIF